MKIFSGLYTRTMRLARHRKASYWLALVSFSESSFFVIPPDVMLAPMSLAKPERAWFYATITTMMSVLGGLFGYLIGIFAFDLIEPWLHSLHYIDSYHLAQQWFDQWGFWAIFLAGFTPIPYKVFTIAAGVIAMPLASFIIGSLIGRGLRFYLVAALMKWGGAELEEKLTGLIDWIAWSFVVVFIVAYLIWM